MYPPDDPNRPWPAEGRPGPSDDDDDDRDDDDDEEEDKGLQGRIDSLTASFHHCW